MQNINLANAVTAVPAHPGGYFAIHLTPGTSAQLGITGPQKFDGSAPFSIGFWVRLMSDATSAVLLSRPGAFSIGLQNNQVGFAFGDWGTTATVSAQWPLTLNDWHYIIVTYSPGDGGNPGTLTFYVDSAIASEPPFSISGTGNDSLQPFILGGNGGPDAQIMSACFWSTCLPKTQCTDQWSMPVSGAPDLVAAFDFAGSTLVDVSGNNYSVSLSGAVQIDIFPALALTGSGYATPSVEDSLTFASGSDPFTVQMDVYPIPYSSYHVGEQGVCLSIIDTKSGALFAIHILWLNGQNNSLVPIGIVQFPNKVNLSSPNIPFGGNIAVTYDGNSATLYIGGQLITTQVVGTLPTLSSPKIVIGAEATKSGNPTMPLNGFIQQLSIWNACLVADDIIQYMTTDPTSDPRCIAYVPFNEAAPANVITDEPITLQSGAAISEFSYTVPQGSIARATVFAAPPRFNRTASPSPRHAMLELAEKLKIDASVRPRSDLISDAGIDAIIGDFEDLLARVPWHFRKGLRTRFTHNLYTGLALHAATNGKLPGQIVWSQTPDVHIFSVETGTGTREIVRVNASAISPCAAWIISVITQCVVIVLGIFGLGFAYTGISNAIRGALGRIPTMGDVLRSTVSPNGMLPVQVLQTLYNFGQLGPILVSGLANVRWWNWVFTIAGVLLRIGAIWLTGGVYLAAMVASIALELVKVITLYAERPKNCP